MHNNDSAKFRADICCVGHITLDRIVTPRGSVYMPGGTAYYFAHGMCSLPDADFLLVTSLGSSEMPVVEELEAKGVTVKVLPSDKSVFFENIYGEDMNDRTQRVLAKAAPFTPSGLEGVEARYFHLGSLLADDFPTEVLRCLSDKGTVSVDAQGYLREVRGCDVYPVDWHDKDKALPYIDILKANESEMKTLTGSSDARRAARLLAGKGVGEVLLTLGSYGSLIYAGGRFHEIPAYRPSAVVDATGCGDTYMTGYLYMRDRGASHDEAGRYAAAMCTLKLEHSGPFSGSWHDIESIVRGV